MVASPAVMVTGLALKVPACSSHSPPARVWSNTSITSSVPPIAPTGNPPPIILGQSNQVGFDAELGAAAAIGEAEAHHLIGDEQYAVGPGHVSEGLDESGFGSDQAKGGGQGVEYQGGQCLPVGFYQVDAGLAVVPGQDYDIFGGLGRRAQSPDAAGRAWVSPGFSGVGCETYLSVVVSPVVGSFELGLSSACR